MTYPEAVAYLEALVDYEKLGFRRHFAGEISLLSMAQLLTLLGDPQDGLRFIHIAGTKGKGSVAALVEAILRAAGYTTGLFSSPHLVSFRERIRVNGVPVSEDDMARLVATVQPAIEEVRACGKLNPATFFEAYTAMAIIEFARQRVDFAVIEVGLGGRLDSTNLINPIVTAITTLGLDHTEILGETLAEIAAEKAGIMKPGVPCIAALQKPEAEAVLQAVASQAGAPLHPAPAAHALGATTRLPIPPPESASDEPPRPSQPIAVAGFGEFDLALLGEHQTGNAAVALGVIGELRQQGWEIPDEAIAAGLRGISWSGRFDIARTRPWFIYDCAHNGEAARALAQTLRETLEYDRLILVLGVSGDKDVLAIAEHLAPLADIAILTQADNPRALPATDLAEQTAGLWRETHIAPTVDAALALAASLATARDAICITGSFYVVGEAMVRQR